MQQETPEARGQLGLRHKYSLAGDPTAPVALLVHGRAGTFDVMSTFRRCLPAKCSIIAPQAPEPDMLGGYSWWDVETDVDRFPAVLAASELLLEFMKKSLVFYALEPRIKIAFGFSQGAGLLSLILQREPALLTRVALLAGFVIKDSRAVKGAPYPKVFIAHGSKDDIVPSSKARLGMEYLQSLGVELEYHEDAVGHKVGAAAMKSLKAWVERLTN